MPVAPTYPGVYIEEIPSGVHTLTGVATSITAFVGFTPQGEVNKAVHIFNWGDFERAFGGLAVDSLLSYSVNQFFQNGGGEAYVVRVAENSAKAKVTLLTEAGSTALEVEAKNAGTAGNLLQLDVDYATSNPDSTFNLRVTEMIERNGALVPGRDEMYRNLSLNDKDPNFVKAAVNGASDLIGVAAPTPTFSASTAGRSISGPFKSTDPNVVLNSANKRLVVSLNGKTATITLPEQTDTSENLTTQLRTDLETAITNALGQVEVSRTGGSTGPSILTIKSKDTTAASSVHISGVPGDDAAKRLHLGLENGGTEIDAVAAVRPAQTGTVGDNVTAVPTDAEGKVKLTLKRAATALGPDISLQLWGGASGRAVPTSLPETAATITQALADATPTNPLLAGAVAQYVGRRLRVLPGPGDPNLSFTFADDSGTTASAALKLAAGNVARYAPGRGITSGSQTGAQPGSDGTPPKENDLIGSEAQKTGIYALEDVDLFNLLVIPDATEGKGMTTLLGNAIAYCTRRRAMAVLDVPSATASFDQAQAWLATDAAPLRSRNSALYYPRLRAPDQMMNGAMRNFPAAGALAGLFARTDGDRGIWKAPAGTMATIAGATGLSYPLTDKQNGTLNQLGLNCLRTFPVYGTVCWGARTGRGADALADEYKYVPVRRLALFLEESLYRGTKWAVFEPNDEPLWAQIRLNLGAFMHSLFAQGAFQGQTPRAAYFVKCDKETTSQNDIDLGRVNIVVGFAPLKPAEFVVIQIQQIAGAIQT